MKEGATASRRRKSLRVASFRTLAHLSLSVAQWIRPDAGQFRIRSNEIPNRPQPPHMEPILQSHFVKFKSDFEINTGEDARKEASAFERFVNYVLLSIDYPGAFAADTELLDVVSVGGADDTFIDGIGIAVNDRLVRSVDEMYLISGGIRHPI
jgi:hypothetical protein